MSDHHDTRCPSCDTPNPPNAAFCTHCGKPVGGGATAAPAVSHGAVVGAANSPGVQGYIIAAVAVGAVLLVGGALFLLADPDEADDTARTATPTALTTDAPQATSSSVATTPVTEAPTTLAPVTTPSPDTTLAPAPSTLAPTPTAPDSTTPLPPPPTPPPPPPGVSLTFTQADGFFRNYIATAIDGDYNAAWNMLSTSDQADYTNGFDQFVGFWRSVSFADVQQVESVGGSVGFQSLIANVAYGQVDGDATSFEIIEVDVNVRPDGAFQIFDYRYIRNQ